MATPLNCPVCQTALEWTEEFPYRPFCSERCKDSDFCAWANEELVLPGDAEGADYFSESEALYSAQQTRQ